MNRYTSSQKTHYQVLDGLRGVAAIMVICYHVCEGFATSAIDQNFNHGYLAVDFFFALSGFVIGYAYDDRWSKGFTAREFIVRRLLRLHPMVVLAATTGVVAFALQGFTQWDGTSVSLWRVVTAFLLTIIMIPAWGNAAHEVRGNGEMFPLNGPSWSLFFEYIGNVIYMLLLRRMSTKTLATFTAILGATYIAADVANISGCYNMGLGWTLAGNNFAGGMVRMLFSFSAGMLLSRTFTPCRMKRTFELCSLLIIVLLAVPYVGTTTNEPSILNAIYESLCVIVIFPTIVWLGASGVISGKRKSAVCCFLGDISYPLYIIHYPLMYLFYHWLWSGERSTEAIIAAIALLLPCCIALAYMAMRFYDTPLRTYISKMLQKNRQNK